MKMGKARKAVKSLSPQGAMPLPSVAAAPPSFPNHIASPCFYPKYPLTSKNSSPILPSIESKTLSNKHPM
jgi:hypothetical protein